MAYSYELKTGTGATDTFTFTFSYLEEAHITVTVDGTSEAFTFPTASSVQITSGNPANAAVVRIKRTTPVTAAVVDFVDGSVLGETDLDNVVTQLLYVTQEAFDAANDTIQLDAATSLTWDAETKKIVNLVDPTADQDAATKAYVDLGDSGTITSAAAAASSASAAATSESAAASSASAAASSASAAATSESAAAASATAAAASETNAGTSETNAAASAASAANNANAEGTSTTSNLISVAAGKSFTTQTGKNFTPGIWLLITSDADPTNYMHGFSTAYSGTALTFTCTNIGGSGTFTDWTIRNSGTRGAIGDTGPTGATGQPQWQGAWVTSTAYALHDSVSELGSSYICLVAHTSGTFATDLAAVRWELIAQKGADGSGDLLAANNLSDVAVAATALTNLGGIGAATTDTLTNKTLTSPVITTPTVTSAVLNTGVSGTAIDTDDTLAADSDTLLPSQQAVKAHVAAQIAAIPAATAGLVPIERINGTTNVDSLDFETGINSTYRTYILKGWMKASTVDDVELWLRTSTDGGTTYDATAGNYGYAIAGINEVGSQTEPQNVSASATKIVVAGGSGTNTAIGNGAAERVKFSIEFDSPASTTAQIIFAISSVWHNLNGDIAAAEGGGNRIATGDIDAISLLFESGQVDEYDVTLYGVANS